MGAHPVVTATWVLLAAVPLLGGCSTGNEAARPNETVTATVTEHVSGTPASTDTARPTTQPSVKLRLVHGHQQHFQSPTGNIDCYMLAYDGSRWVECTVEVRDFEDPPRPNDCELDWSPEFDLGAAARYGTCRGDANEPQTPTELPYGAAASNGPLLCISERAGLTCRNQETGHGFMINREHFDTF